MGRSGKACRGAVNQKAYQVLEICHSRAHECDDNPEDYILVSLTEREFWTVILAMTLAGISTECLVDPVVSVQEKLAQARRMTKQEWIERYV